MNGILSENQLTNGKEYEFIKPLIHKIDFKFDNCYRDCHQKYYHLNKNVKMILNLQLSLRKK